MHDINCLAWLETKSGARTVAYTVIMHGCEEPTLWSSAVSPGAARQHQAELWQTVQRRRQLLPVLLASVRSMAAIGAAYANPVLSIAAVRQAWKLASEISLLMEEEVPELA